MEVADDLEQLREGVFAVWLEERHLPFVVGVMADEVGDLLEDQDHADRGEEAANHAGGHERFDEAPLRQAEGDLDQPGHHHGQQQRLERAEHGELGGHDGHEPGGGPGDHHLGAAEPAHDHARDDAGDHAADRRGTGSHRDADAERQRHEERHQTCHQVGGDVARRERGVADEFVIQIGLGHGAVPWSRVWESWLDGGSRPAGSGRKRVSDGADRPWTFPCGGRASRAADVPLRPAGRRRARRSCRLPPDTASHGSSAANPWRACYGSGQGY